MDNSPAALTPPARPRRRIWRYVILAMGLVALGFVVALVLSFRPGAETRALRDAVFAAAPGRWQRQFEVGVGALPAFLARSGLGLVRLEPEARAAIQALRSGAVGVYQHEGHLSASCRGAALARIDEVMAARHWTPAVRVLDGDDAVGVFVHDNLNSSRNIRVCVVVIDGEDLVLVAAKLDTEPLQELVKERFPKNLLASRFAALEKVVR